MKYSEELKNHIVEKVIAGEARICDMAKQYSIPAKRVSLWVGGRRKQDRETGNLSKDELLKRASKIYLTETLPQELAEYEIPKRFGFRI